MFYIIKPQASINLVTNPSPAVGTTGHNAVGAGVSIARVATYQRRHTHSIEVTTASGVASSDYFGNVALTSGITYTFSVDVLNLAAGQSMRIYFADTGGAAQGMPYSWVSNGYWERKQVTWACNSTTNFRLYVMRDSVASVVKFYCDGFLCEASTAATTYFDGDNQGYVIGERAYWWTGAAYASTSQRSANTRSGGLPVDIQTYCRIKSHYGFGMPPVQNFAAPISGDGSIYQGTRVLEREASLNLIFTGDLATMRTNRKALEDLIKRDAVPSNQDILIRYLGADATGADMTEPVDIRCSYKGGMELTAEKPGIGKATLSVQKAQPFLEGAYSVGADLGVNASLASVNYIIMRTAAGVWQKLGTGTNGAINCFAVAPDGSIYLGGAFTLAGGVANTIYIAKWDGSVFTPLGTGVTAGTNIYALAVAPDGTLYAGGGFTTMGGVANTAYIAKWSAGSWSALSTGMNGAVRALAVAPDGTLYAGGDFTLASGVANTAYIAKWNGATWTPLSTGMNGSIYAISIATDGTLYAGGAFALASGVANTAKIAKWNGSAWTALSTGANATVSNIVISPDGALYAGGGFTLAGGVANTAYIARWDGSAWNPLGSGLNAAVYGLSIGPDGILYVSGGFTLAGNLAVTYSAKWNNFTWTLFDIVFPGGIGGQLFDLSGNFYAGFNYSGAVTITSYTTPTGSSSETPPILKITGPGALVSITNYTNGSALYFNGLTLGASEVVWINTDPLNFSAVSSFRGNVSNYILRGSTKFTIEPGANNIAALMTGTTGASSILAQWTPRYWGIEQAVR
jgi:hypothetical protein